MRHDPYGLGAKWDRILAPSQLAARSAVQRHLRQRGRQDVLDQESLAQAAKLARLQAIEDAARDVVVSAMCGEPVRPGIERLRVACGIECSPV